MDAPILVSACLLGARCRYDGRRRRSTVALARLRGCRVLPVCPEMLGGLPVPRPPAWIVDGAGEGVLAGRSLIRTRTGGDVTSAFLTGARAVLDLAGAFGVREAILKSRSPSCGVGLVARLEENVSGDGVAAALLARAGLRLAVFDFDD